MAKKRVLVFIDWFLPGDKAGGPVRSVANLIAHLSQEYEFAVITRDTDYTERTPYSGVLSDTWNDTPYGARVYYISEEQLTRETISRLLKETAYDHVYLNGIWSQPFTRWPLEYLRGNKKHVPVTIAVRGMLAPSAMAIKRLKKKTFLAFAKLNGFFDNVTFHATTDQEREEVKSVFGKNAVVHVAGNLPRKNDFTIQQATEARIHGAVRLVSVARIAPEKNTLFAINVLAEVKATVTFDVWGACYDTAYYEQCQLAVADLPKHITVNFHGPLDSGKIAETLADADALFLPTRGENFGHIILEAMQCGLPVLISDQTPWKELEQQLAGWDLPLDNPKAFAEIIDRLAQISNEEMLRWKNGALLSAKRYTEDPKLIGLSQTLFG
jgi:glycosyltransferase involved in cell wall biosynthesis